MLGIIPKSIESPMTCDDVEIPNMGIFNIAFFSPSILTDLSLVVSASPPPKHSACAANSS